MLLQKVLKNETIMQDASNTFYFLMTTISQTNRYNGYFQKAELSTLIFLAVDAICKHKN